MAVSTQFQRALEQEVSRLTEQSTAIKKIQAVLNALDDDIHSVAGKLYDARANAMRQIPNQDTSEVRAFIASLRDAQLAAANTSKKISAARGASNRIK